MSSLSPYRTPAYDDAVALATWQANHERRHMAEQRAASRAGTALPAPFLDGKIDANWHGRHYQLHQGLVRASSPSSTYALAQLATGWHDKASYEVWMHLHTQVHRHIDRVLGVM